MSDLTFAIRNSCMVLAVIGTQLFTICAQQYFIPEELDVVVSDKSVVLLGELDHGDGSSFAAKTEVIKYLHEEHGFNVLAFEAGIVNCHRLWELLDENTNVDSLFKRHLYYVWSEVKETKKLFNYLQAQKQAGTPLTIVGIDPQFSGKDNARTMIDYLIKFVPEDTLESQLFIDYCVELVRLSKWLKYPPRHHHRLDEDLFMRYTDVLQDIVIEQIDPTQKALWQLFFRNTKVNAAIKWEKRNDSFARRDKQMFYNLDFWKSKHHKIIVWAANAHIIRQDDDLMGNGDHNELYGVRKLGDFVYELYCDQAYSIAIAAGKGETLRWPSKKKRTRLKTHKKGSLEYVLNGKNTFTDLKSFEKRHGLEAYEAQMFYTNTKCSAKWSNHFDGVLFLTRMNPSTAEWKEID